MSKDGAGERESGRAGEKSTARPETEGSEEREESPGENLRGSRAHQVRGSQALKLPNSPAPKPPGAKAPSLIPTPSSRPAKKQGIDALQANMGHFFKDPYLIEQALTHSSASVESGKGRLASYERLEFLGDAVVNLCLAFLLYDRYPGEDEGVLTRLRAYWVSQASLAQTARDLGFESVLRLGVGETRDGGARRERTLASSLEASFGALFLDGGHRACAKLAKSLWGDAVRRRGLLVLAEDAKTALQELRQAAGLSLPDYRSAPAGEGFASEVVLDGKVAGRGEGASRKAAEQGAARDALGRLPPTGGPRRS